MGSDYMLVPPSVAIWKGDVGATTILADKIRSVPGVGTVSTLRYAQSEFPTSGARGTGDVEISVLGIDPADLSARSRGWTSPRATLTRPTPR